MFVARWQFTCRFGRVDDCVAILRKWEMDVGVPAGWKPSAVRVTVGAVGAADSEIELESRVETLADLEGTWRDMEHNPHHREYVKQLESVIVGGTSRWTLHRTIDLIPGEG
jgi:hypothetical protein